MLSRAWRPPTGHLRQAVREQPRGQARVNHQRPLQVHRVCPARVLPMHREFLRRDRRMHRDVPPARPSERARLQARSRGTAEQVRAQTPAVTRLQAEQTHPPQLPNQQNMREGEPMKTLKLTACAFSLALILSAGISFGQQSPSAGNAGTPYSPPSGNYPGSGSSPQPGVPPAAFAPSGPTPGSGNGGVTNTPPSGVTPGSGASPNPPQTP